LILNEIVLPTDFEIAGHHASSSFFVCYLIFVYSAYYIYSAYYRFHSRIRLVRHRNAEINPGSGE